MKKILFVCPYPSGLVPSQRFRFEQYLSHLREKGFNVDIQPFLTEKAYRTLYQSGNSLSKIHAIWESCLTRLSLLLHARSFDYIFIHREAAPVGPPILEYVISKILKKKIVYDFDDAIWLTDKSGESFLVRIMRWRGKVSSICRWSYKISCGNAYLANFAARHNTNVRVIPTTIDTYGHHLAQKRGIPVKNTLTMGWTGSRSTLKYLEAVLPALREIEYRYADVEFLVIADENPKLPLRNYKFLPWRQESEIADLEKIDIGIMPLPDDPWTRGKCGFKALQYMALEIPAVVSPVGANREIIQHGVEGYWCTTPEDWTTCLEALIQDPLLRKQMGEKGRQKVLDHYSVAATSEKFLSLFQ